MKACSFLKRGAWRRFALAVACCTAGLGLSQQAMAVGDVVVSQVWGGGGLSAGTPNANYVELFNRTANPVTLTGWSVNIASSGTSSTWSKLDLVGTIQPYSYFLVRCTTPSATGIALPTEDQAFSPAATPLGTTIGKVALRSVTTAIGAIQCPPSDATLIDLVTYGTTTTTCREGAANAPAGSTTGSGLTPTRQGNGCVDTDDNGADFSALVPNPRNTSSPSTGGCVTGACCNVNTGACTTATSAGCTSGGGTYQGDGSLCSSNPCPPTGACCNGATGSTCTALTSVGCAAISGFYQGDGSLCSPNPCATSSCCLPDGTCCNFFSGLCTSLGGTDNGQGVSCTAVGNCNTTPANDLCANATTITAGTTYVGNNWAATSTGDGLNTLSVTTRSTKGVWYRFIPSSTSAFDISGCGSTFDAELQVFVIGSCADPATWTYVAADDDRCAGGTAEPGSCNASGSGLAPLISGVQLNGGQTYYIRVNLHGTSATGGGNFHLLVSDVGGVTGACCNATTGQCEVRTMTGCTSNAPVGVYQGDGMTCSPTPCATVAGACCFSGGVCVLRAAASCTGTNIYQGDNTLCSPDPCVVGACCNNTSGACTITLPTGCTTGTYQGDDTTCTPSPCPAQGSCCNPCTFACTTTVQAACSGTWTMGGLCSPNPCVTGTPPANDDACNAVALTAGVQVVGQVGTATLNDGLDSTCQASAGKGVWYSFTPSSTGYHGITTCGTTFDNVLTVFTGACADPFTLTEVDCDDDTCAGSEPAPCGTGTGNSLGAEITFVFLNAGTNYLIRVQTTSATAVGGTFPITINTTFAGACCNNTTGACTLRLAGACTTSESYQGDNTVCDPTPCPAGGSCCNDCTFACTSTIQAVCGAGSTWTQGGVCTPSPCIAGAAPANDLPCNAIALTLGNQVTGTLATATGGNTDEGPSSTCQVNGNKGVWYTFTPANTGDYTISTCGATFDSVLTVFTGDCNSPAGFVEVACDDDTCAGGEPVVCGTGASNAAAALIGSATLNAGTTYYIRVQVFSTGTGGTFPISVTSATTGACCAGNGDCTVTLAALCPAQCAGVYQGDNTTCSPGLCPTTIPDTCATALEISGHFVATLDNNCAVNENDEPADTCNSTTAVGLMNSIWLRFVPGADGQLTGSVDGPSFDLSGALYSGSCGAANLTLVACWDDPEPWDLAVPEFGSTSLTAGVTYFLVIGDWGTGEGGGPTPVDITIPGPVNGACCNGSSCSLTTQAACTGANTSFAGAGSVCNVPGNATTPCCKADYNHAGGITVQDIFDFLAGYFTANANADINGSGTVTVQDIFDFLAAYFAGGC